MILLDTAGGVLILAGLAMLIWKHGGDSKSDVLGVKIQGPAGLFVLIVGAACLVLGNFHSFKELVGGQSSLTSQATQAVPTSGPPAEPSFSNGVFPANLAGTWTGVYQQSNGHSYRVELVVTANLAAAQVRYPDLGCFGTVTAISRSGSSIRAQESILNGKCTPTGTLNIELQPNDQLDVSYVPDVATYTAHAVLIRQH